jgi:hypothetical protein
MAYAEKNKPKKEKAIKQIGNGAYQIDMSKVKSDDPLAYSFGYVQGKEGQKMSESKNLAPAYIEGYNKGKEEHQKNFKIPQDPLLIGHEKDLDYYETTDGKFYSYSGKSEKDFKNPQYWEELDKTPQVKLQETYEAQTNKTPKQSISYLQDKNANFSRHNWSFEVKDDKTLSLTLGNMSDAGWYWNGNEKELVGFTYQLHQSKVEDEFYAEMKKNNVSFNQLKPLYLESAKEKDGLYEISGDDVRWQFGETGVDDYYMLEEEGLTESQKEQFYEEYSPISYEEFEKKYGEDYRKDVKNAIKSSSSFREFNIKMDELREKYSGLANEEDTNSVYLVIGQIKTEQSGTNLAKYKKIK